MVEGLYCREDHELPVDMRRSPGCLLDGAKAHLLSAGALGVLLSYGELRSLPVLVGSPGDVVCMTQ